MSAPIPPPDPEDPANAASWGQPPAGATGDPLVPSPMGGLAAWIDHLVATIRRVGRPLMLIFLLTFALPQLGLSMVTESLLGESLRAANAAGATGEPATEEELVQALENLLAAFTFETVGTLLLSMLGVALVASLGWSAGIWAITEQAAGLPVRVGAALRAGAGRMLPMLGWYLLYALIVAAGLVMCVLPGLYLGVAGALFSFVVIFERGRNPLGRAFALCHQAFGLVLGRVALLGLVTLTVSCLAGALIMAIGLGEAAQTSAGRFTGSVVDALISIPLYVLMLVGLFLTYTQARARQEPVATVALWRAANPTV